MGRDVKRVPLDFDWPLNKVWQGYLLPERLQREDPCPAGPACLNGQTAARAWVGRITELLLMLDDDRRDRWRERPMHPYFDSVPGPYSGHNPVRPSLDIAEFGTGLAGGEGGLLGHDGIDRRRAEAKIIEAAGLDPKTWGICPTCGGHGDVEAYPGQRADAEDWKPVEPPTGDGWQLWSVSKGSPVSPVFPDAEALAQWLTTTAGGEAAGPSGRPMTIEQARAFVSAGWAPTGVVTAGGFHEGASFVGSEEVLKHHFDSEPGKD